VFGVKPGVGCDAFPSGWNRQHGKSQGELKVSCVDFELVTVCAWTARVLVPNLDVILAERVSFISGNTAPRREVANKDHPGQQSNNKILESDLFG